MRLVYPRFISHLRWQIWACTSIFAFPFISFTETGKDISPEDINDHKSISLGTSAPMDDGRGYPQGFGYFYWKRSAWPWTSSDFKLVFAGISGDVELTLRDLINENTDLGFGLNYQTMGRFEEYQRGQIDIGNRMNFDKVSGRLFLQQHVIVNYVEIAKIHAAYEFGYENYSRDDDTTVTFTLAPSGLFQTVKLGAGTGTLIRSNYSPKGWNLNLNAEATFRDHWRQWGPPNLWDSPSEFQKFQMNTTYVASCVDEQKLVIKLNGGIGNGLDRLSTYKIGGALVDMPHTLTLHGFYTREIFAEDYLLIGFDHTIPILQEQQFALHLYWDGALTRRTDISDRASHIWAGTGAGVSFKGWWDTNWLLGYGYGINAQRGTDHGGHELFAQMSKEF